MGDVGIKLARKDFGILSGATQHFWFDAIRSATEVDSVEAATTGVDETSSSCKVRATSR